jgi:hypothetical protein
MAGKAVPSTGNTGPRDFSAEVHSHFAKPPEPGTPGSITMRVALSEADAGKVTSMDLAAAIIALLARHGITSGYRVSDVSGSAPLWIDTSLDGDALAELATDLRRTEDHE